MSTTLPTRPAKPHADFPLFPHRNGRWCKKVRGRFCYFGRWDTDRKGEAALRLWLDQKDDLLAGRTPRTSSDKLSVRELCNRFLTAKQHKLEAREMKPRSFADYVSTCKMLVGAFGPNRPVEDLASDDFQSLRVALAKTNGLLRLGNQVIAVRSIFKFGFDCGLLDRPVRFGPSFTKPAMRHIRAQRQANGLRMFEADQLRTIIDKAEQPLKAMIYLACNCGFGNADCGTLPMTALDLKTGWITYPRPKTAVERRCPLWPETIKVLEEVMAVRPTPKQSQHHKLVFITRRGMPWTRETPNNPVSLAFRKLLDELKLYRPGLGFYALRHTFETIASASRDQIAVNHIMGHADSSMAGVYRERIDDDRLRAVTAHVHKWLFETDTEIVKERKR